MSQGGQAILVIDDEMSTREFISSALRNAGYRVLDGGSYEEALVLHEQCPEVIDLLLVDAALPDRNGFELARVLCQARPELRVLLTSGHVGAELCRFYGMSPTDVRFLQKPFLAPDLIERVRCLLAPRGRSCNLSSS
jgi:DNA-binding response OmpR family regulator